MLKTIKRTIQWVSHYKKRLYTGFIYSFFISIFTAMPVIAAAYSLNSVFMDMRGEKNLSRDMLWLVLAVIVVFVLLRFLFLYLKAKTQESIGHEVGAAERIYIGDILKRVSLGYFSENSTGDISATITTELSFLELMGIKMLDIFISGYISVAATILCLAFFSLPIALISLAGVLLSALFLHMLKKMSEKTSPITHKAKEDMTGATIEYLRGMSVVKTFGREGEAMGSIRRAYADSRAINIKVEKGYAPVNALHLSALKLASAGIVWVSSLLALNGQMEVPYMLMMLIFSFSIFSNVETVNDSAHMLGIIDATLSNLERLKQIEYIDDQGRDIRINSFDISFDHVTFAYDRHDVIKNVSFTIPQNTTTAIVGPSGSGKTTLCNLLARFYDVNAGKITVGGYDVREFTCDSLLSNISMVFQNVYLFHDTIENNIRFGKPGATTDEIIKAAKQARCHDFITALPKGYDTVIGEGGSTLSGGEKQRISIARAILKNAPIVILDEATASIDPENEYHIQAALSALTHGKTIIIIAHRLATIENADQILVLDDGQIAQKGTHKKLMGQKGIYKRFLSIRQAAEGWTL